MEKLKNGKSELEKVFVKLRDNPEIIYANIFIVIFSFVLSHSTLPSGISPFAVPFFSVIPEKFIISSSIGLIIGFASSKSLKSTLKYAVISAALRIFFKKMSERENIYEKIWFIKPVAVFVSFFVGGFIQNAFIKLNLNVLLTIICESFVAMICTYFFDNALEILRKKENKSKFNVRETVCLAFSFSVFIISFSSLKIFEISLSKILVSILILLCAFYGGEVFSSLVGTLGGISIGIYSLSCFDIISFSLCSVVCGVFSSLGKLCCAILFIVSRYASYFLSLQKEGLFCLSIECAVSVVIFLAFPFSGLINIKNYFEIFESDFFFPSAQKEAAQKIKSTCEALNEINESIENISSKLEGISNSNVKTVYCKVQDDVCKSCKKKSFCFENHFFKTFGYFEEISDLFLKEENLQFSSLPQSFLSYCEMPEEFFTSFEKHFRFSQRQRKEEKDTGALRKNFSEQLVSMSSALSSVADDILKEKQYDFITASKIKSLFKNLGADILNVVCTTDEKGVMKITATLKGLNKNFDKSKVTSEIENITLRKFEMPVLSYLEKGIEMTYCQKPWISSSFGIVQYSSSSNKLCGDYCENYSSDDTSCVIVCDGMGTGGRAAVDSAMTAGFFKKLVMTGFNEDCALKLVNSSMLVKSAYESLSTVDYVKIDLFTGKTEFFKAGAAATVIKRNGRTSLVEGASLPVGILRDIEFSNEKITLSPGDIIVMMSDGVTAYGTDWIEKEIESFVQSNPNFLARKIANKAIERSDRYSRDDITVAVMILS